MTQTITSMLEDAATRFGTTPYLTEKTDNGWEAITVAQTREAVIDAAAALDARGWKTNTTIIAEGRTAWVVCELAVLTLGGVSVPLSIKLQAEELPYRINHADVGLIVCSKLSHEKIVAAWPQFDHQVAVLYLDQDEESLQRLAEKTGLKRGKNLLSYKELIEEGGSINRNAASKKRIEDMGRAVQPDQPASVAYTSGTTGNPKGITLSHRNYFANVRDSLGAFYIPDGTKMFVVLPIDHSYAHTIALYVPLMKPVTLIFVDARGGAVGIARNLSPNMVETNPDMMLSVPALTATLMAKIIKGVREKGGLAFGLFNAGIKAGIKKNGNVFNKPAWYKRVGPWFVWAIAEIIVFKKVRATFGKKLRFSISGGAMLELKQQEFFKALGFIVYQGYGLSEASPVVSTNAQGKHKLGSSGRLLPNLQCKIVDDQGNELPVGQKGQIVLKGDSIMLGYWKNPEATAEVLKNGWLYSGDLGFIDKDDFLYVVGREKALLITEDGEKYSPEEIEEAIVACSENRIQQTMLWCDHKPYVSAVIVLDLDEYKRLLGVDATAQDILEAVVKDFSAYKTDTEYGSRFPRQWLPKTFTIVAEPFSEPNGMINSTLKMVRRKIVAAYQSEIDRMYTGEGSSPENDRNLRVINSLLEGETQLEGVLR